MHHNLVISKVTQSINDNFLRIPGTLKSFRVMDKGSNKDVCTN